MGRRHQNPALNGLALLIILAVFVTHWLYDRLGMPMGLTYALLGSVAVAAFVAYIVDQNR